MTAILNNPTATRHGAHSSIWEQTNSRRESFPDAFLIPPATNSHPKTFALDETRSDCPVVLAEILTYPGHEHREIEISSVFRNAWKREIYDAWVDFDMLPAFMRGCEVDSNSEKFAASWFLEWGDRKVPWEAHTTECLRCDRISWQSADVAACRNCGCVSFASMDRGTTRLTVNVQFDFVGTPTNTDQMLRKVESQLQDILAFLHTFLAPHALPPALASL